MPNSSVGRLTITRCFGEKFYLRLGSQTAPVLLAQDLFRNPVCITIQPSSAKINEQLRKQLKQCQFKVRIEADKRITILREELLGHQDSGNKNVIPTRRLIDANLAEMFMSVANSELSTRTFHRLSQLAQAQLDQLGNNK